MPLPNAPTQRPNNPQTRRADAKNNALLLILGLLCTGFGLGALLLPTLIDVPEMQETLATTTLAGWVLLGLGGVLIALHVWLRRTAQVKP